MIFGKSNKTTIGEDHRELKRKISMSLKKNCKNLDLDVEGKEIKEKVKNIRLKNCEVHKNNIKKEMKKYPDVSIYPMDKSSNENVFICKRSYKERLLKKMNEDLYVKIDITEKERVKERIINEYEKIGISKKIKISKDKEYAYSYIMPKFSDLNKERIIVSMSRIIYNKPAKIVARALKIIYEKIEEIWMTFNNVNLRKKGKVSIKEKINEVNNKWKKNIYNNKITFIKYDLENCFNSLSRKYIEDAIANAIRDINEYYKKNNRGNKMMGIKISKNEERREDAFWYQNDKKNDLDYFYLNYEDIKEFCKLEEDMLFIKVGQDYMFKQERGLPMGANTSPMKMNIFAAYMENKNKNLWVTDEIIRERYVDDIAMIIKGKLGDDKMKRLYKNYQKIYEVKNTGINIKKEMESYKEIHFLDNKIGIMEDKIYICSFNKNYNEEDKNIRIRLRYPDIGVWTKNIYTNMIKNMLEKRINITNDQSKFVEDMKGYIYEWKEIKKYKDSVILEGAYRANRKCGDIMRILLKNRPEGPMINKTIEMARLLIM
jgi:hypothetical protein